MWYSLHPTHLSHHLNNKLLLQGLLGGGEGATQRWEAKRVCCWWVTKWTLARTWGRVYTCRWVLVRVAQTHAGGCQ